VLNFRKFSIQQVVESCNPHSPCYLFETCALLCVDRNLFFCAVLEICVILYLLLLLLSIIFSLQSIDTVEICLSRSISQSGLIVPVLTSWQQISSTVVMFSAIRTDWYKYSQFNQFLPAQHIA